MKMWLKYIQDLINATASLSAQLFDPNTSHNAFAGSQGSCVYVSVLRLDWLIYYGAFHIWNIMNIYA